MITSNSINPSSDLSVGSNGEDFGYLPAKTPAAERVMLRDFLPGLLDDVLTGEPPPEYHFDAKPWGMLAFRPREITCIGGPPNCGKTGLTMKMTTGALLMNPKLRAVYACVEMDERILMERTLARLSGVYLSKILKRDRDAFFKDRIEAARARLESLADRLMFVRRPFTMIDVRAACEEFQPDIVVLDYVQRIAADERLLEERQQVTEAMTQARLLADQGPAVLLIAALNRQSSGQSQKRANATDDNVNDLAAFRGGSDIEYSIDDGYVLTKDRDNAVSISGEEYKPKKLVLRHLKARNSLIMHIPLIFDGRLQEFSLRDWEDKGTLVVPRIKTPSKTVSAEKEEGLFDPVLEILSDDKGGHTWLS
jgi:replicative DNA helicase